MEQKPDAAHYLDWLQLVWEALAEEDQENREAKLRVARLFLGSSPEPSPQH